MGADTLLGKEQDFYNPKENREVKALISMPKLKEKYRAPFFYTDRFIQQAPMLKKDKKKRRNKSTASFKVVHDDLV